jgi:hypothetical protein
MDTNKSDNITEAVMEFCKTHNCSIIVMEDGSIHPEGNELIIIASPERLIRIMREWKDVEEGDKSPETAS